MTRKPLLTFFVWVTTAPVAFGNSTLEESRSAPEMNFRLNAVNLEVSTATVEGDFKLGSRLTLGPVLGFTSTMSDRTNTAQTGFILGARGNLYLTGEAITDGWYLAPQGGYSLTFLSSGAVTGKSSSLYLAMSGGYHWVWESGFNAMVGAGTTYYFAAESVSATGGNGTLRAPGLHGLAPYFDISLGMAL